MDDPTAWLRSRRDARPRLPALCMDRGRQGRVRLGPWWVDVEAWARKIRLWGSQPQVLGAAETSFAICKCRPQQSPENSDGLLCPHWVSISHTLVALGSSS